MECKEFLNLVAFLRDCLKVMVLFGYWNSLTYNLPLGSRFGVDILPGRLNHGLNWVSSLLPTIALCSPAGSRREAHSYTGPLPAAPAPGSLSLTAQKGACCTGLSRSPPDSGKWGLPMLWAWQGAWGCIWSRDSRGHLCAHGEVGHLWCCVCWGKGGGWLQSGSQHGILAGWGGMKAHVSAHWHLSNNRQHKAVISKARLGKCVGTNKDNKSQHILGLGIWCAKYTVAMVTNSHDLTTKWALPIPILQLR